MVVDMNDSPNEARQANGYERAQLLDLIYLHPTFVVGAALKLAMSSPSNPAMEDDTEELRKRSGLSLHHWRSNSMRVINLALILRGILPLES